MVSSLLFFLVNFYFWYSFGFSLLSCSCCFALVLNATQNPLRSDQIINSVKLINKYNSVILGAIRSMLFISYTLLIEGTLNGRHSHPPNPMIWNNFFCSIFSCYFSGFHLGKVCMLLFNEVICMIFYSKVKHSIK